MEWIDVNDKQPEFDKRVLVSDGSHTTIAKLTQIDSKGCGWERDCSFSFISGKKDIFRGVVKWMPLPEPPK
ncbi:MAG TPA: DUF551 domain-containing protein [Massilibacterium sp.]|nr:DUF551 domain-containing protein [Massilibacterium sp.]